MNSLKTIPGDLFSAPKGVVLAHACNTKGRWGSGVAAEFAKRFPRAYADYQRYCKENGAKALGTCYLTQEKGYYIACLFTSKDYGQFVDPPEKILRNTQTAMNQLLAMLPDGFPIHLPKINSGLFRVPWQKTLKILKKLDGNFTVWYL